MQNMEYVVMILANFILGVCISLNYVVNLINSLVRLKNITFSIAYSLEEYSASRNMIFLTFESSVYMRKQDS